MSSTNQTRAITLQLPEEIYQQISQTADHERRGLEDLLSLLIVEGLSAHTTVRQSLERVSAQYRARLAREGQLNQTAESVLQGLRDLREQVADELYPE